MRKILLFFCVLAFFLVSCGNKINEKESFEPEGDTDSDQTDDSDEIDDTGTEEEEPVSGLKVEANDKNVLSCRLSFSTPEDKKTFVKYYSASHSGYKIDEDSAKTEHYFFLWGMRENLDYKIEIYDEKSGDILATAEFHSGFAPVSIYPVQLVTNEKDSVQPGFLLMVQNTTNNWKQYPVMFMVDTDGFIVWYYEHDSPGGALLCDPKYNEKTKTVFAGIQKDLSMAQIPFEEGIEIDLEGNLVWKSPAIASHSYSENGGWHHQYSLLDDDTVLFIQAQFQGMMLTDRIVNVDRNYNELLNWGYLDSPDYFGLPDCADSTTDWCDWTHTNAVMMYKNNGEIYLNSLRLGFYKMDMNTKQILWKFSKDGDFIMLSEHDFPWTDSTHSPEFRDSSRKTLLFFDNGMNERPYSRVIEYEIDEEAKTAEITFEYDGIRDNRGWYAETGWGDADYLDNGNILVAKGWVDPPENSSVFEITRDGRVVWELNSYQDENFMVEIYKVEKFMPPLEFLNE